MRLKILLPFAFFFESESVTRIVAETSEGSFGFLPQRLDCVMALVPGILTYETESDRETYVAIDEGIMIKAGADVWVSVRSAVSGTDLSTLRKHVEAEYVQLSEQQASVRSVLKKMESSFMRRLSEFRHE